MVWSFMLCKCNNHYYNTDTKTNTHTTKETLSAFNSFDELKCFVVHIYSLPDKPLVTIFVGTNSYVPAGSS